MKVILVAYVVNKWYISLMEIVFEKKDLTQNMRATEVGKSNKKPKLKLATQTI